MVGHPREAILVMVVMPLQEARDKVLYTKAFSSQKPASWVNSSLIYLNLLLEIEDSLIQDFVQLLLHVKCNYMTVVLY